MPLGNLLLLSQAAAWTGSFVVALCVLVPLYGSFDPKWNSGFFCGFTLFVGLLSSLISLMQVIHKSLLLKRGVDSSFLSAFIDSVISAILTILALIACIFVTRGFSIWCSAVTERFTSCEVSEAAMKITNSPEIDTSSFFLEMGTVQFGIWTSFVIHVFLLVLASRKVFVYHERANIAVSMAKERLRYSGTH